MILQPLLKDLHQEFRFDGLKLRSSLDPSLGEFAFLHLAKAFAVRLTLLNAKC